MFVSRGLGVFIIRGRDYNVPKASIGIASIFGYLDPLGWNFPQLRLGLGAKSSHRMSLLQRALEHAPYDLLEAVESASNMEAQSSPP